MPRRPFRKSAARRYAPPIVDLLESRMLLSAAPVPEAASMAVRIVTPIVSQTTAGATQPTFVPAVGFFNPTQLQTAYGVNLLGAANQGQGVTIAIVDVFDDSTAVADVNAYSAQYNLPKLDGVGSDPTIQVIKNGTVPASSKNPRSSNDTSGETSLDLDMVHAIAPKANLILVEVPSFAYTDLLAGVQLAAGEPGVVGVSISYGGGEFSGESSYNTTYLASAPASNVVLTFSTGDGSSPSFPATSPNVVAVGGTALFLASARGKYNYETAWGGWPGDGAGGGGVSSQFATPTFQSSNGVNFGARSIPDVSMDADPITGVSVYDSYDDNINGGDPWTAFGGTSAAAPLMQGVIALAQQDRLAAQPPLPLLNSVAVDTAFYQGYNSAAYSSLFHDVTLGKNADVGVNSQNQAVLLVAGFSATTGYDLATGIGSPIANALVPYLNSPSFAALPGIIGAGTGSGTASDALSLALTPLTPSPTTTTMLIAVATPAPDPLAGPNAGSLVLSTSPLKKTSLV